MTRPSAEPRLLPAPTPKRRSGFPLHSRRARPTGALRAFLARLAMRPADADIPALWVGAVEQLLPGSLAVLWRRSADGARVRTAACSAGMDDPTWPEFPLGAPVACADTAFWSAAAQQVALRYGLPGCAAQPIDDDTGRNLGALAVFWRAPHTVTAADRQALETAAHLALLLTAGERVDHLRREAAAAERDRLARDLHDAVTQTLFSTNLTAEVLPNIWERDPEQGRLLLAQLRDLTRSALGEMRALLLELRPQTLLEQPPAVLLPRLAEVIIGRNATAVSVTVTGDHYLPPDVQVAFYRIAQEALNNIAKHAGARHVSLALIGEPQRARLAVIDDGRGFDPQQTPPHSLGLTIMRERAARIGAQLRVESVIGEGAAVTVVWPAEASDG